MRRLESICHMWKIWYRPEQGYKCGLCFRGLCGRKKLIATCENFAMENCGSFLTTTLFVMVAMYLYARVTCLQCLSGNAYRLPDWCCDFGCAGASGITACDKGVCCLLLQRTGIIQGLVGKTECIATSQENFNMLMLEEFTRTCPVHTASVHSAASATSVVNIAGDSGKKDGVAT